MNVEHYQENRRPYYFQPAKPSLWAKQATFCRLDCRPTNASTLENLWSRVHTGARANLPVGSLPARPLVPRLLLSASPAIRQPEDLNSRYLTFCFPTGAPHLCRSIQTARNFGGSPAVRAA